MVGTSNVCKEVSLVLSKHTSSGALGIYEKVAAKEAEELNSISTQ